MGLNRKEFLKRCYKNCLALFGTGSAFYIMKAADLLAGEKADGLAPGPKWFMAVDVMKCASCENEKCAAACHGAHAVPMIKEKSREVKWIWRERFSSLFPEMVHGPVNGSLKKLRVAVLCNHCENPPCVRVCPAGATWKRADGIVAIDPHRCIGCRYCMAACPYGARSFNFCDPAPFVKRAPGVNYPGRTKGVVEKCTLCYERAGTGAMPLCVEACEKRALIFGDLNRADIEMEKILAGRTALIRKAELGTGPRIYYLL